MAQLSGKVASKAGVFVLRPIGMKGHPHHQRIGLPGLYLALDQRPAGIAHRVQGGLRLGMAQHATAHRHASAFEPHIKSQ